MRQKLLFLLTALMLLTTGNAWGEDIASLPFYKTWTTAGESTTPFDAGSVIHGTNVTALNVNNTTATAWFNTNGEGAPYTLITDEEVDEEVTISFTAYHGWNNNGANQGVKIINSGGHTIAEYVYNLGGCNLTAVNIGGAAATGWSSAYNCQSKSNNQATKNNANGFTTGQPYQTTEGWNPVFTFKISKDRSVSMKVYFPNHNGGSIDNTYTGTIPNEWDVDIQKIQVYSGSNNSDRTIALNNLSITSNLRYIVKAQVSGSDLKTLASGTAHLDGSTTVYWNKYINVNDQWYKADGTTYGTDITEATTNVPFTATDVVSYFFEAEDMELSRAYEIKSNNSGYSIGGGKGVYASSYLTSTSKVPAGGYTFSIGSVTRTVGKGISYKVSYSTDGVNFVETGKSISFTTTAGSSERSVTEVLIPVEAYIRLTEGTGYNANDYVDYVVLKQTNTAAELAIADCKQHETSAAFAAAIDAESFETAAEVYAFHTAWQVKNASSKEITKVIFDAQVSDFSRWNNARNNSGQQYTGAPDNKYFDAWNNDASDGKQKIYGLPAGTYTLKAATRASDDVDDVDKYKVWVKGGSADVSVLGHHDGNTGGELGNGWSWTTLTFTLDATADVEIGFYSRPPTERWTGCDDFHLYAEGVSVTLPSSGYGSLALSYGLDFSGVEGLTAYVVTDITNTQVKLTSVSELPANSGVILKGTGENTYDIPMKADATYEGENKLYAAVTAYDCAANEVYILQGGLFHLVTEASTVPAGKAYLKATDVPNEARSLIISDEEDPTAINVIEAEEVENGLKDGKYLIGNKIVLVKNGVKYGTNGQKLN